MSEECKDLLPCPFCGSDSAGLGTSQDDDITKWSVLCSKCGASCSLYCDSEPDAVELWNMRTPADSEAHAEIQRLQDAKRRALALADERAKENVALREAAINLNGLLDQFWNSGSETSDGQIKRICAAQQACKAALSSALPASEGVRARLERVIKSFDEQRQKYSERADDPKYNECQQEIWASLSNEKADDLRVLNKLLAPEPAATPDEGPDPLGYAKGERA